MFKRPVTQVVVGVIATIMESHQTLTIHAMDLFFLSTDLSLKPVNVLSYNDSWFREPFSLDAGEVMEVFSLSYAGAAGSYGTEFFLAMVNRMMETASIALSYDDSEAKKLTKRLHAYTVAANWNRTEFFFPESLPNRHTSTSVGIRETGGQWIWRVDKAGRKTKYAHINWNPDFFSFKDPHTRIPEFTPQVVRVGAKVVQTVNKIATPAAIIVDAATVAYNAKKDYDNGTTRNSVTNAAGIAGGWTGAFAGAELGVCVGAAGGPVGALVGAIVGGIVGGIGGGVGAETVVDHIGDACEYNMEIRECQNGGHQFMARSYLGNQELCGACQNKVS